MIRNGFYFNFFQFFFKFPVIDRNHFTRCAINYFPLHVVERFGIESVFRIGLDHHAIYFREAVDVRHVLTFKDIRANKLFLATAGISSDMKLTYPSLSDLVVKSAMIESASKVDSRTHSITSAAASVASISSSSSRQLEQFPQGSFACSPK